MNVYIVFYINSAYDDVLQKVFSSEEMAQAFIDAQKDSGNYYFVLRRVND